MHYLRAIGLKVASTVLIAVMALLARYLGQIYPLGEVVFVRASGTLVLMIVIVTFQAKLFSGFKTERLGAHAFRSTFAIVGMFTYFGALARLPLAEVTAIAFLAPVATVLLAALLLRERVHAYRWTAVAGGFIGVLFMVSPFYQAAADKTLTAAALAGLVMSFAAMLCTAGAALQTSRLAKTEPPTAIIFYLSLFTSLAALPTFFFGWVMPLSWFDAAVFAMIGVVGGFGQLLFAHAFRFGPPSLLAPFDYLMMVWTFVLGYVFLAEVPTIYVVIGALIVASTGIFVILRERAIGIQRARVAPADPVLDEAAIDPPPVKTP